MCDNWECIAQFLCTRTALSPREWFGSSLRFQPFWWFLTVIIEVEVSVKCSLQKFTLSSEKLTYSSPLRHLSTHHSGRLSPTRPPNFDWLFANGPSRWPRRHYANAPEVDVPLLWWQGNERGAIVGKDRVKIPLPHCPDWGRQWQAVDVWRSESIFKCNLQHPAEVWRRAGWCSGVDYAQLCRVWVSSVHELVGNRRIMPMNLTRNVTVTLSLRLQAVLVASISYVKPILDRRRQSWL